MAERKKTIFICRYLRDRDLQREINSGLNTVEGWHDVNDVIFFGKSGELAAIDATSKNSPSSPSTSSKQPSFTSTS